MPRRNSISTLADPAQVEAAIQALHSAPPMVYAVCTGAGAGLTQLLWSVPGCSRTLIASEFPYDPQAFADLIGRLPRQYSSCDAAVALAAAGYLKGQRCLFEQSKASTPLIALGLAAAVSTDRSRRGDDKVFISIRTATGTRTVSAVFERGRLDRAQEGEASDLLSLNCLLDAAGLAQVPLGIPGLACAELGQDGLLAPLPLTQDLSKAEFPLLIDVDGNPGQWSQLTPREHVLFPGSFNPLHFGHDLIAQAVVSATGKQVVFELATANADKPGLAQQELAARALQFRGRWPVLLSPDVPLFLHKARLYGGFDFVLGLDTAVRLFEARYFYSQTERDATVDEFRRLGTRFIVCDRGEEAGGLERLVTDPRFVGLFVSLPLRFSVSSTELRGGRGH